MRACWIDEGQTADYPRLIRHGVTDLYFSPRINQGHSKAQIDEARSRGFRVGIYREPSWDGYPLPVDWAKLLSADVTRLGGNGTQMNVQANIETHSMTWFAAFLAQWRKNRAFRETSVAFEGFQGGLLANIRAEILAANVTLVPECYEGDMTPQDSAAVIRDLYDYDFPYSRILPFYDAARLPRGWYGFCFTQQRLPA